jgi:hypothetical protein
VFGVKPIHGLVFAGRFRHHGSTVFRSLRVLADIILPAYRLSESPLRCRMPVLLLKEFPEVSLGIAGRYPSTVIVGVHATPEAPATPVEAHLQLEADSWS